MRTEKTEEELSKSTKMYYSLTGLILSGQKSMGVQQCGNASSSSCAQGYAHVVLCLRLKDFWKMHTVFHKRKG